MHRGPSGSPLTRPRLPAALCSRVQRRHVFRARRNLLQPTPLGASPFRWNRVDVAQPRREQEHEVLVDLGVRIGEGRERRAADEGQRGTRVLRRPKPSAAGRRWSQARRRALPDRQLPECARCRVRNDAHLEQAFLDAVAASLGSPAMNSTSPAASRTGFAFANSGVQRSREMLKTDWSAKEPILSWQPGTMMADLNMRSKLRAQSDTLQEFLRLRAVISPLPSPSAAAKNCAPCGTAAPDNICGRSASARASQPDGASAGTYQPLFSVRRIRR